MAGPESQTVALGDAMIAFQTLYVAELSLVSPPHWARTMEEPQYPANPYTMCPRLRLQLVEISETPGPPAGGMVHGARYAGSWFYYRRQIPGQPHQRLLHIDVKKIRDPYLRGQFQPANLQVEGLNIHSITLNPTTILTELRHKWDDPALRVSVAQISFVVEGEITNCP